MKRLQRRFILLTAALLAIAAIFVSLRAVGQFEASLTEQALAVEQTIGRSVTDVIQKALLHNVPFDNLVDAEGYLETVKRDNPGVAYLIITASDGRLRFSTDMKTVADGTRVVESIAGHSRESAARVGNYFNTAIPITHKGATVGWLHVGERANIVEQMLRAVAFDILTVLVVATLVAFELVRLLLAASFATPLRALHQ